MCAGNRDELYARARMAGEAIYLLEESLEEMRRHIPDYQSEEALTAARAAIALRRDDYALEAFDRAVAATKAEEYDLTSLKR